MSWLLASPGHQQLWYCMIQGICCWCRYASGHQWFCIIFKTAFIVISTSLKGICCFCIFLIWCFVESLSCHLHYITCVKLILNLSSLHAPVLILYLMLMHDIHSSMYGFIYTFIPWLYLSSCPMILLDVFSAIIMCMLLSAIIVPMHSKWELLFTLLYFCYKLTDFK